MSNFDQGGGDRRQQHNSWQGRSSSRPTSRPVSSTGMPKPEKYSSRTELREAQNTNRANLVSVQQPGGVKTDRPLPQANMGTVRLLPLGGQGENGRSCFVIELDKEILIVDSGIGFAPHGVKGGVDFLRPNIQYLSGNKEKIVGLVVSNPHEDYAGDILKFIDELEIKNVYLPKTLIEFHREALPADVNIHPLVSNQKFAVGKKYTVTPYQISFTAPDSHCLLLDCNGMRIFYAGGYKIDHNPPISAGESNLAELAATLTEDGVDLLLNESVNVEQKGYSPSESSVCSPLRELFTNSIGRIIVVTVASALHRLKALCDAAIASKRKIILIGDDLKRWFDVAKTLNYFDYPQENFLNSSQLDGVKDEREAIVIVGVMEGEVLRPFVKMAQNAHPQITLKAGDTILLSGEPPLGATRIIANCTDQLYIRGIRVLNARNERLHVPAHASQEELKLMYNLTRPKYFLPTQGETRQLVLHAELMGKCGIDPRNIIIVDNGTAIDFDLRNNKAGIVGKVPAAPIFASRSFEAEMSAKSIDERKNLSEDGTILVVVAIDSNKCKLLAGPKIQTAGSSFSTTKEWSEIKSNILAEMSVMIGKSLSHGQTEAGLLRRLLHDVLNKRLREKFGSTSPLVSIVIQDCAKQEEATPVQAKAPIQAN